MTWATIRTRLRRWLRDPSGAIWTDAQLLRFWNQAGLEIAQKTGVLERAEAYRYPSPMTWAYLHECEWDHAEGDRYRALSCWQAADYSICYPWEPAYWHTNATPADDGYRWTQPWETGYASPGDVVPVQISRQMHRTRYMAYDEEEVQPITRARLASEDEYYRSRSGVPTHYFPVDETEQRIGLYPRPSSVTWQDPDYDSETYVDTGGVLGFVEGTLERSSYGLTTEVVDTAGALFAVYETLPVDLADDQDASDYPDYLIHYVEMAALERAYGADTDGFIPTLREYWGARKELGLAVLRRWKAARLRDRTTRIGTVRRPRRTYGQARLPDHYPALPAR